MLLPAGRTTQRRVSAIFRSYTYILEWVSVVGFRTAYIPTLLDVLILSERLRPDLVGFTFAFTEKKKITSV